MDGKEGEVDGRRRTPSPRQSALLAEAGDGATWQASWSHNANDRCRSVEPWGIVAVNEHSALREASSRHRGRPVRWGRFCTAAPRGGARRSVNHLGNPPSGQGGTDRPPGRRRQHKRRAFCLITYLQGVHRALPTNVRMRPTFRALLRFGHCCLRCWRARQCGFGSIGELRLDFSQPESPIS